MDIAPYVGGESGIEGVEKVVKLASNEGALGPSPRAVEAMRAAAAESHRYPDGAAADLRTAIAARYGVEAERIVCGAGSDELLTMLCRAYAGPGDEVLYPEHGFAMYPITALSVGATPVKAAEVDRTASVDNLLGAVTERTKLLFLANPNNPTGTWLPAAEVRRLRAGLPEHVLLVLDAAYAEFVSEPDYEPGFELVDAGDNTVMTRTFSKIHALGGLRLGWAYCPAPVADVLNRVRGPFNVSAPALAAGLASFEDEDFIERSRLHNDRWRDWTRDRLVALGLDVTPSVCNFLLVCFGDEPGRDAASADAFLKSRGIIVRRVAGYGFPNCLRISIGLEDEMRAVVEALREFLGRNDPDPGAPA